MEKDIYEMKLHDEIEVDTDLHILRVPGGWLYKTFSECAGGWFISSEFVAYNEEFQNRKDTEICEVNLKHPSSIYEHKFIKDEAAASRMAEQLEELGYKVETKRIK